MKKLVSLVLVVLMMAVLFAGCAPKAEAPAPEAAPEKEEAAPAPEKEEAPAEQEEAAPEASGEPLKIGLTTPLTSTSALAAEEYEKGFRLAIDTINAAGGINGRMLEAIAYDNEGLPEGATKNVTRMIEVDGVSAIVGCYLSSNVLASAEINEKAGVVQVVGGLSPTISSSGYEYLLRGTCVSNYYAEESFVNYMKDLGYKNVAVLAVESEYGQTGIADMQKLLPEAGMTIVSEETFQMTDSDFTAQTANIVKSGAEALVLYVSSDIGGVIAQQLRRAGFNGAIFGDVSVIQDNVISLGGESMNGTVGIAPFVAFKNLEDYPDNYKFVAEDYFEAYGALPTGDTPYRSYGSVMIIAEGMKNAENVDDPKSIAAAIKALEGIDILGATVDYVNGGADGITQSNAFMYLEDKLQAYDKAKLEAFLAAQ